MSWKDYLVKILTPKNTEEIKPNLFIQTYNNPDSLMSRLDKTIRGHQKEIRYPKYRNITPAVLNNKLRWIIVILGAHPIKSLAIFLFILFMAWSYKHDVLTLMTFRDQLFFNDTARSNFCNNPMWYSKIMNLSDINFTNILLK